MSGSTRAAAPRSRSRTRSWPGSGGRTAVRCWTARSWCSTMPGARRSRRWPSACTCGIAVEAAQLAAARPVTYMIFDVLAALRRRSVRPDVRAAALDARHARSIGGDHWLTPPMFADGPATRAAADEIPARGRDGEAADLDLSAGRPLAGLDQVQDRPDRRVRGRRVAPGRSYHRRIVRRGVGGRRARLPRTRRRRHLGRVRARAARGAAAADRGPLTVRGGGAQSGDQGRHLGTPGAGDRGEVRRADAGRPAAVPAIPADPCRIWNRETST